MINVCGVTFDHTINYGSCFQAYALQTAIENMTVEGESCHYDLVPLATMKNESIPTKPKNILTRAKRRVFREIMRYRRRQFELFEKEYMHFADCHHREDLPKLNERYDAFVCGSDVIWNFRYTKADEAYFLQFANKYSFSYAASFGRAEFDYSKDNVRLPEPFDVLYKKMLFNLDQISVRENSAVELARRFTDKNVIQVCDPVFLLTPEEWYNICKKRNHPSKYIFAYSTRIRPIFMPVLKKIAKETGLPVVHVTWLSTDVIKNHAFSSPEPNEWLYLLKNAEYVVTNSFHATAFSTLFHKKFFTVVQGERKDSTNIRLYDYLDQFGLTSRMVYDVSSVFDYESPDFTRADAEIENVRKYSVDYLVHNLEAAYIQKVRQ